MDQGEIFEYTWEKKENEWLPYVKIDVLATALFIYNGYGRINQLW